MTNTRTTRNVLLVLVFGCIATVVQVDGARTNECPFEVCRPEEATVILQFSWEIPGLLEKRQESFYLRTRDGKPEGTSSPVTISVAAAGKLSRGCGPLGASTTYIDLKEISAKHIIVSVSYSLLPPRTEPGYDNEKMRTIRTQEAIVLPYADVPETSQGQIKYSAKWWCNVPPNVPATETAPRH